MTAGEVYRGRSRFMGRCMRTGVRSTLMKHVRMTCIGTAKGVERALERPHNATGRSDVAQPPYPDFAYAFITVRVRVATMSGVPLAPIPPQETRSVLLVLALIWKLLTQTR